MGIQGLYGEIGNGERIALVKYSLEHELRTGRRLRVAVDASIWSFQVQAGQGGNNPHLRTLYYRLVRLLSHNITPLFVFDGPNRPSFKRGRRTNAFLTPTFIRTCKKLLKLFGVPHHTAPGEAEAECAALQQAGVVDVVLSEDVDTLMFGASSIIRKWSAENTKSKVPTHVTVYDAASISREYGVDREGIVLVALMHGGDYHPEGISGCGLQTAIRAANAGFGRELCNLARSGDVAEIQKWRQRLQHEIATNASRHFKTRNSRIKIPEDWPNIEFLDYYRNPLISGLDRIQDLADKTDWEATADVLGLREYTRENFEWRGTIGAAKFVRTIAPALISWRILDGSNGVDGIVEGIHGHRTHFTTDGLGELRVSYTPVNIVPIDREREEEDDALEAAEQHGVLEDDEATEDRASDWNPEKPERIWVLEEHVRRTLPEMVQAWETPKAKPKKSTASKSRAAPKSTAQPTSANSIVQSWPTASSGNIPQRPTAPPEPPGKRRTRAPPTTNTSTAQVRLTTRRGQALLEKINSQSSQARATAPAELSDPDSDLPSLQMLLTPRRNRTRTPAHIPLSSDDDSSDVQTPATPISSQRVARRAPQTPGGSPTTPLRHAMNAIDLTSSPEPERAASPTPHKPKPAARPGNAVDRVKETEKEKVRVMLRESLPGSWKIVKDGEEELFGAKTWEVVDVVDLTGDE